MFTNPFYLVVDDKYYMYIHNFEKYPTADDIIDVISRFSNEILVTKYNTFEYHYCRVVPPSEIHELLSTGVISNGDFEVVQELTI